MNVDHLLDAQRHAAARGLSDAQVAQLLTHSESDCEKCGKTCPCYLLHTAGADPTTWHLCRDCHPKPDARSLDLNEDYAEFLIEPLGVTYSEHLRVMHTEMEA